MWKPKDSFEAIINEALSAMAEVDCSREVYVEALQYLIREAQSCIEAAGEDEAEGRNP